MLQLKICKQVTKHLGRAFTEELKSAEIDNKKRLTSNSSNKQNDFFESNIPHLVDFPLDRIFRMVHGMLLSAAVQSVDVIVGDAGSNPTRLHLNFMIGIQSVAAA